MVIEETIERVINSTRKTYLCDVVVDDKPCGKKSHRTCKNCKIDICDTHSFEEDNCGDYPEYFCPDCYKKYRHFTNDIEPMFDRQIKAEYERIMKVEKL